MNDTEAIAADLVMHAHMAHRHTVCGMDGSLLNPPGASSTAPCLDPRCDVEALRVRLAQAEKALEWAHDRLNEVPDDCGCLGGSTGCGCLIEQLNGVTLKQTLCPIGALTASEKK